MENCSRKDFSFAVINRYKSSFILYSVNNKFYYKDVDCRMVYFAKLEDTVRGR